MAASTSKGPSSDTHEVQATQLRHFLLLITAQCMRPADIKDVALVSNKLLPAKQGRLSAIFKDLAASSWRMQIQTPSAILTFTLASSTHKSNGQECIMTQYITKDSRSRVQELCDGIVQHCHQSDVCSALLSWIVSREALASFYDVDQQSVRTSTAVQRELQYLVSRIGGSAVAKTLRFPKHPKPQQIALRTALLKGLATLGYGLEDGSFRPTLLTSRETPDPELNLSMLERYVTVVSQSERTGETEEMDFALPMRTAELAVMRQEERVQEPATSVFAMDMSVDVATLMPSLPFDLTLATSTTRAPSPGIAVTVADMMFQGFGELEASVPTTTTSLCSTSAFSFESLVDLNSFVPVPHTSTVAAPSPVLEDLNLADFELATSEQTLEPTTSQPAGKRAKYL